MSPFSKELAVNSFILSNFNYCPLVWNFTSSHSSDKIERIQERALRFVCENSEKSYKEMSEKFGQCTMKTKRMRLLTIEIFKTLNKLNPSYMRNIFYRSVQRRSERLKFNIETQTYNQAKYGKNSLRVLGPMLWNSLPNDIKSLNSLPQFKKFIKRWGNEDCPHFAKFSSYFSAI